MVDLVFRPSRKVEPLSSKNLVFFINVEEASRLSSGRVRLGHLRPPPAAQRKSPPTIKSPFSHRRYCKFIKKRTNELRGIAFLKMELFERLNKTTFTNARQFTRNTNFCLFLQYLRSDFTISQIRWEVLLRFAKVGFWMRVFCVFETCCLEAL